MMPKGNLKNTKPFSEEIFKKILKEKKYTIEEFAQEVGIGTRTLGRAMKSSVIKAEFFEIIAKQLDICPSILAGTYPPLKKGSLTLNNINFSSFPYQMGWYEGTEYYLDRLKDLLGLFDVSYDDIEAMDIDDRFDMFVEIANAIGLIADKYFNARTHIRYLSKDHEKYDYSGLELLLDVLENERINCYMQLHANTVLREELIKKKPKGYTKKQILRMSPDELIGLDLYLREQETGKHDKFKSKYLINKTTNGTSFIKNS